MNARFLSYCFAFYGIVLLACAAFSFWVNSSVQALILGAAGMGVMIWSHFFNRQHYWGFTALVVQLFVNATLLSWNILAFFRVKGTGFSEAKITEAGFMIYSSLFLATILLLILSAKSAARVKKELC
jgi:hypothetical protein